MVVLLRQLALPLDEIGRGDNADAMGPEYAPSAAPTYFNMRKLSIFGGANEIQRTIISKAILEL